MSMDIRHFKSGFVTVTTYASIAAAKTAVIDAGTGGQFDEFPNDDGFVYLNPGYGGIVDIYLTDSQGTGTGTVYRVRLQLEGA